MRSRATQAPAAILTVLGATVVFAVAFSFRKPDIFGRDVGNVRHLVASDLPPGTPCATVWSYAAEHFKNRVWDPDSRCLSAEYYTVEGRRRWSRSVTRSIHVHFFFDAEDRLIEVRDESMLFRKPLMSPARYEAEATKRLLADPTYAAATRAIAEADAVLNSEPPEWTILVERRASTTRATTRPTTVPALRNKTGWE